MIPLALRQTGAGLMGSFSPSDLRPINEYYSITEVMSERHLQPSAAACRHVVLE